MATPMRRAGAVPAADAASATSSRQSTASGHIVWQCPICGDNGLIDGWEDTMWNRHGGARQSRATPRRQRVTDPATVRSSRRRQPRQRRGIVSPRRTAIASASQVRLLTIDARTPGRMSSSNADHMLDDGHGLPALRALQAGARLRLNGRVSGLANR